MIGLKLILSIKDMKQKEMAERLCVVPMTVSDWITKKRRIPSERLVQLEEILEAEGQLIQSDLTEEIVARIYYNYGIPYRITKTRPGYLKEYCEECEDLTEFKLGKVYDDIFEVKCSTCSVENEWCTNEYERVLRDVVKKII
ncbi:helix-turn-helix domain-containing protein [Niallia taxi]|uniref:helix-turn-helix domain-containing protein n=1 Tax=Niallia taxi TaxID=2499688 RepID=UPI0015F5231C|nr:helix-turn-helix transcriptional regulator [Niallia taxi]